MLFDVNIHMPNLSSSINLIKIKWQHATLI